MRVAVVEVTPSVDNMDIPTLLSVGNIHDNQSFLQVQISATLSRMIQHCSRLFSISSMIISLMMRLRQENLLHKLMILLQSIIHLLQAQS